MMADLHPFIPSGIIVPLAEFRMIADAVVSLHQAVASLSAMLIDRLDAFDGDPDLEDNNDREATDGDDKDVGWPEWNQLQAKDKRAGFERPTLAAGNGCHAMTEDDEDDDPAGQCDEDGVNTALHVLVGRGAGCLIGDQDCEGSDCVPTYGIDQTQILTLQLNDLSRDPVPDFMPCDEAGD